MLPFLCQPVLVYMSKVDGKFKFNPVSVNFLTEATKVLFAIIMLLFQVTKKIIPSITKRLSITPSHQLNKLGFTCMESQFLILMNYCWHLLFVAIDRVGCCHGRFCKLVHTFHFLRSKIIMLLLSYFRQGIGELERSHCYQYLHSFR